MSDSMTNTKSRRSTVIKTPVEMSPTDESWKYRIEKLRMKTGDVLVVSVPPDQLEPRILKPFDATIRRLLPAGTKVLFIDTDIDLTVLTMGEIEEQATPVPDSP